MIISVSQLSEIRDLLALEANYALVIEHLSLPADDVLEKIRPFLPEGWSSTLFSAADRAQFAFQKIFTNDDLLQAFDRAIRYEKFLHVTKRLDAGSSLDNAIFDSFESAFARKEYRAAFEDNMVGEFPVPYRENAKNLAEIALQHPEEFEYA